jgi:hypothetical protein
VAVQQAIFLAWHGCHVIELLSMREGFKGALAVGIVVNWFGGLEIQLSQGWSEGRNAALIGWFVHVVLHRPGNLQHNFTMVFLTVNLLDVIGTLSLLIIPIIQAPE